MLAAAARSRCRRHARRRKGGSGVTRSEAVVLALGAEHEAVEPSGWRMVLKRSRDGEEFVDVGLVADVENEIVGGGIKNRVKGDGQLNHTEVGPEMGRRLARTEMSSSRISWARW